jgi:hypothetical protein
MMFILFLIILALALLAKTISPFVTFSPVTLYHRTAPDWLSGIDPGLSGRFSV